MHYPRPVFRNLDIGLFVWINIQLRYFRDVGRVNEWPTNLFGVVRFSDNSLKEGRFNSDCAAESPENAC